MDLTWNIYNYELSQESQESQYPHHPKNPYQEEAEVLFQTSRSPIEEQVAII